MEAGELYGVCRYGFLSWMDGQRFLIVAMKLLVCVTHVEI